MAKAKKQAKAKKPNVEIPAPVLEVWIIKNGNKTTAKRSSNGMSFEIIDIQVAKRVISENKLGQKGKSTGINGTAYVYK